MRDGGAGNAGADDNYVGFGREVGCSSMTEEEWVGLGVPERGGGMRTGQIRWPITGGHGSYE